MQRVRGVEGEVRPLTVQVTCTGCDIPQGTCYVASSCVLAQASYFLRCNRYLLVSTELYSRQLELGKQTSVLRDLLHRSLWSNQRLFVSPVCC